jgi:hypothetical protein
MAGRVYPNICTRAIKFLKHDSSVYTLLNNSFSLRYKKSRISSGQWDAWRGVHHHGWEWNGLRLVPKEQNVGVIILKRREPWDFWHKFFSWMRSFLGPDFRFLVFLIRKIDWDTRDFRCFTVSTTMVIVYGVLHCFTGVRNAGVVYYTTPVTPLYIPYFPGLNDNTVVLLHQRTVKSSNFVRGP